MATAAAIGGAIFGAGLLGPLADRIGRRRIFRFDPILFIAFSLICMLAWNVWSLIAIVAETTVRLTPVRFPCECGESVRARGCRRARASSRPFASRRSRRQPAGLAITWDQYAG